LAPAAGGPGDRFDSRRDTTHCDVVTKANRALRGKAGYFYFRNSATVMRDLWRNSWRPVASVALEEARLYARPMGEVPMGAIAHPLTLYAAVHSGVAGWKMNDFGEPNLENPFARLDEGLGSFLVIGLRASQASASRLITNKLAIIFL
jgi:hypothetical protein